MTTSVVLNLQKKSALNHRYHWPDTCILDSHKFTLYNMDNVLFTRMDGQPNTPPPAIDQVAEHIK